MSKIHPWLILGSASLLRGPKLIIVIPILLVFLLAYNAVYDFTLRPLNGKLVSHFNNFTLHDGSTLNSPSFLPSSEFPTTSLHVAKLTFAGENTLRYQYLCDLFDFQTSLQDTTRYILSPVTSWPIPLQIDNPTDDDKEKAEKYILKTLNLDQHHELTGLFFDRLGKKNHMIQLAGRVHIYAFYDPLKGVPDFQTNSPRLQLIETRVGKLDSLVLDFKQYYQYLRGELFTINLLTGAWIVVELVVLTMFLLHVYLSVCNQHKIRSNVGLMIGWLTENSMSAFASLCILSYMRGITSWIEVFGPLGWRALPSYFILTLVLSSRNLFRTINDLAGDNAFGAPENLHKRVIKYYLGINNSVQNSQGVFWVSRMLRQVLMLDFISAYFVPIPNNSVILIINLVGITIVMYIIRLFGALILDSAHHEIFSRNLGAYLAAILLALALDHLLQLTFLVGIIVIDLNRIDLTDLLSKSTSDTGREEITAIHEVNPISSWLLGLYGSHASPKGLRYRLGTYCLKISPESTNTFWTLRIPFLMIPAAVFKIIILKLAIPEGLAADPAQTVPLVSDGLGSQSYDILFYSELLTIIVFVIAISQLTFTLTYSKRQRKEVDSDEITALISPDSGLTNTELAKGDEVKFFESITLSGSHQMDILKLQSNPKSSFLVSTDLDHKVLIWSPLSKVERDKPQNISTFFESSDQNAKRAEFWPINHIVVGDYGNYIVLINNKHCRIKCFDRKKLEYVWEISLTSELNQSRKKMHVVTAFFRKKTVAGFLARKLLLKKKAHRRRNSATSILSATTMTGNYPPPNLPEVKETEEEDNAQKVKEDEGALHREEFVMVLESGEMITIACDDLKIKVYNPLTQIYEGQNELLGLKIISLKLLKTARVNDRIICNLSNDDIIVGTAVNNIWRFHQLDIDTFFSSLPTINFAPPLMSRTGSAISLSNDFSTAFELQRQNYHDRPEKDSSIFPDVKKYPPINQSAIITIDFVGMVVRVKDLRAQLVDIQTGTIIKVFDIGHFKPGTFRVVHSEPTHCKFCGCASFESISLVYQDFYEKMLIMQTFAVENKKSRNNICLRVERDPREIRCVGFDSVIEKHFWYYNIEMWEVTDMNVIVGIRKNDVVPEEVSHPQAGSAFAALPESGGLASLRSRNSSNKPSSAKQPSINDLWQGFVITAQNGKLLEYSIPVESQQESDFACTRPNCIVKYGYKSVAIAFGRIIKILFLGNEKLIESDLYYSGTTSTLNGILKPSKDGVASSNELLFINKRRRMLEKKTNV